ncbi:MAG TPA: ATP-binding cassette domain-containing protein [Herbaspirillum sp.]
MRIDAQEIQAVADGRESKAPDVRGVRLHIEDLSKIYGRREVLKAVSLDIAPGEFVAIVGRSGCGKSTLLRLVADLERPSGGEVRFDAAAARNGQPEIRIMFQESRLLPWKRVVDNVALGLSSSRADKAIKKGGGIALKALQQVRLQDRAGEWPAVLSGGQRQRVALARALVHDPELLLLDEPLGALDALTRIEMQQLIESLWRERGFTAVLVTHDVQEAVALADRVVLIEDGAITLDMPIDLARPRLRGNPRFAQLEEAILSRVLRQPVNASDDRPGAARDEDAWQKTFAQVRWAI